MSQLALAGKRVLVREDLNVPIRAGQVSSDARIVAAVPTIRQALKAGAAVMVLSHLGRPEEGKPEERYSLAPVARRLGQLLGQPVPLVQDWLDGVAVGPGQAVLCENVRFNPGETADDQVLAQRIAALCDIFVMDAFGTAHRAQASTHGVARYAAVACAGPLLVAELQALGKALGDPVRPLVAIVGGAKVSTKLELLRRLLDRVDRLIVGGGIANTFIAAAGYSVGGSLYEPDLVPVAVRLIESVREAGSNIAIPTDVVVAAELSASARAQVKPVGEVGPDEMILDIGPDTAARLAAGLASAGTVVWNGPLGVFEHPQFAAGTRAIGEAVARSRAFSIAGGGDTLAALDAFGIASDISYISTGGGAFLEFLEGRTLPAVAILEERAGSG